MEAAGDGRHLHLPHAREGYGQAGHRLGYAACEVPGADLCQHHRLRQHGPAGQPRRLRHDRLRHAHGTHHRRGSRGRASLHALPGAGRHPHGPVPVHRHHGRVHQPPAHGPGRPGVVQPVRLRHDERDGAHPLRPEALQQPVAEGPRERPSVLLHVPRLGRPLDHGCRPAVA